MNVLFVSKDLAGGDLAHRLKKEGNNVKLFIDSRNQKQNFSGIVKKTEDWKAELGWVGKNGLVIFDDIGYGKIQDDLRKKGYSVVGGSAGGDDLENSRLLTQKILTAHGIKTIPSVDFHNTKDAIGFIRKNRGAWVIKQNGSIDKAFNYVGQLENGEDVIEVLKNYNRNNKKECQEIHLQKKVVGVEIGVARYFNGTDWIGPVEMNVEHKSLCDGDLGPKTDEMGTLMWYDGNDKKNKLFQKTLSKLKPYLQEINFRGNIDINCIVNGGKAYPLEITARFGWPATQLQDELNVSPWGGFLKAVADGREYDLKYKKDFGIIVLLATPPFPYDFRSRKHYPNGLDVFFKKSVNKKEMDHMHFEEISLKKNRYTITSKRGYIMTVSNSGKTVGEAREKTYRLIDKIVIPKSFYRTDIGLKFVKSDKARLKKWGWI